MDWTLLAGLLHDLVDFAGSENFKADLHKQIDELVKPEPAAKPKAGTGSKLFTPIV